MSNGDKDFKSPKAIILPKATKVAKLLVPKPQSKKHITTKRKTPSTKRKPKNAIVQSVKENFQQSDVNPEHLQMALALSKSVSEAEMTGQASSGDEEAYKATTKCQSTQDKVENIKRTLIEFGFKCSRSKLTGESSKSSIEVRTQ